MRMPLANKGKSNDSGDDKENEEADTAAAEKTIREYMEQNNEPRERWQRIRCCGASRYLYCTECYRLLIPQVDWPEAIREKKIGLPFQVDILLDDRRKSSTGVQIMSILKALEVDDNGYGSESGKCNIEGPMAELYDIERNSLPAYDDDLGGTYLLFPGETSEPLSSVLQYSKIKRLILLDCTWSCSSLRLHPSVRGLPQVCLDSPPRGSFFWRWHNAGDGMLSTAEALFCAAWQITESVGWTMEERKQLVNYLWLFSLQRSVILRKYTNKEVVGINPHLPWTEEAKDFARQLRVPKNDNARVKDGCR